MATVKVKQFRTNEVVQEFECSCQLGTRSHETMIVGLLRNMDLDRFYVDDYEPVPVQAAPGEEVAR